jgi:hypothetical protein
MKCTREAVRGGGGKGSMNDKKRKRGRVGGRCEKKKIFIHWQPERR